MAESCRIRSILLMLGLVSMVGMPYSVLMPIFGGNVLHGGAHTLGFLMGASGVGALAERDQLAMRRNGDRGLGKMIAIASADVRRGPDPVRLLAVRAAVDGADDGHRIRHDAADGGQQHDFADHRRTTTSADG